MTHVIVEISNEPEHSLSFKGLYEDYFHFHCVSHIDMADFIGITAYRWVSELLPSF